jgi:hypothetical protein
MIRSEYPIHAATLLLIPLRPSETILTRGDDGQNRKTTSSRSSTLTMRTISWVGRTGEAGQVESRAVATSRWLRRAREPATWPSLLVLEGQVGKENMRRCRRLTWRLHIVVAFQPLDKVQPGGGQGNAPGHGFVCDVEHGGVLYVVCCAVVCLHKWCLLLRDPVHPRSERAASKLLRTHSEFEKHRTTNSTPCLGPARMSRIHLATR